MPKRFSATSFGTSPKRSTRFSSFVNSVPEQFSISSFADVEFAPRVDQSSNANSFIVARDSLLHIDGYSNILKSS